MGFRRLLGGFLWPRKHDGHDSKDEDDDANHSNSSDDARHNRMNVDPIPGPRKGFSVPVKVAVERPVMGPILVPCNGDGGVQGLRWYAKRLRIDVDGDLADEFLDVVLPETSPGMEDEHKPLPRFQVNNNTRHAKVRDQAFTHDRKLQHYVECEGRLQWL